MSARTLRLAALFLDYPDQELWAAMPRLAASAELVADADGGRELRAFAEHRLRIGSDAAQEEYVATFDFHKRASLYLTYYRDGDRRQRGASLLGLKRIMRESGYEVGRGELPDYLPVVLEFASLEPGAAEPVLRRFRAAIELLRAALRDIDSPYAGVLDAVTRVLPAMGPADLAEARRIAAEGPPDEDVGLEPFAPPEVMPYAEAAR